jgi:F-box and leucine-rich repeat protein GRR1
MHRYRIHSPVGSPSPSDAPPTNARTRGPANGNSDPGSESDSDTTLVDTSREDGLLISTGDLARLAVDHAPGYAGLQESPLDKQSIVETIPYEILLNIFRFLEPGGIDNYRCLFVCKAWANCAVETLWFRPPIKRWESFIKFTGELLPNCREFTLFPYTQFVRRLNLLSVASQLSSQDFKLLKGCAHLERLTMGGAVQVTSDAVAEVIPNFKKLLALDISQVDLNDFALCAVAQSCRLLQGLNVSQCTQLTDASITVLAENCHNLRRVLPPTEL